jgi:hypothetical protein
VVYKPGERPSQAGSGIVEGDGSIAENLVPFANARLLEGFVITLAANRKMCGPSSMTARRSVMSSRAS